MSFNLLYVLTIVFLQFSLYKLDNFMPFGPSFMSCFNTLFHNYRLYKGLIVFTLSKLKF